MKNYTTKQINQILPADGRAVMTRKGSEIWAGPGAFIVRLQAVNIPLKFQTNFPTTDETGTTYRRLTFEAAAGSDIINQVINSAKKEADRDLEVTDRIQNEFRAPNDYFRRILTHADGEQRIDENLISLVYEIADRNGTPVTGLKLAGEKVCFYNESDLVAIVCLLRTA